VHKETETIEEINHIQEEILQETPFAQSQIVYTPNVFDEIFKRDYRNFVIANLFSCLIYVVWGLFFYFGTLKVLGIISLLVSAIFIFRFIQKARQYKRLKANWVEEFVGQTRIYNYYQDHIDVSKPDETTQTTFYYRNIYKSKIKWAYWTSPQTEFRFCVISVCNIIEMFYIKFFISIVNENHIINFMFHLFSF